VGDGEGVASLGLRDVIFEEEFELASGVEFAAKKGFGVDDVLRLVGGLDVLDW
jgi:hypothetical protein